MIERPSIAIHMRLHSHLAEIAGKAQRGSVLRLDGVTVAVPDKKGMHKTLLDDVHVEFASGKLTAIMGASGAGKSTLLNVASMRCSHNMHLSGGLTSNGLSIQTADQINDFARSVGFVPQQLDLTIDLELTAAENLYVQVRMRWDAITSKQVRETYKRESRNEADGIGDLVIEVLAKLDLLEHANTRASHLSGGQKRRLAIATECIKPLPVIFLDGA